MKYDIKTDVWLCPCHCSFCFHLAAGRYLNLAFSNVSPEQEGINSMERLPPQTKIAYFPINARQNTAF